MSKYLVLTEDEVNKLLIERGSFGTEEQAEVEARGNTSTGLRSFVILKLIKKFSPSRQVNEFYYE